VVRAGCEPPLDAVDIKLGTTDGFDPPTVDIKLGTTDGFDAITVDIKLGTADGLDDPLTAPPAT